MARIYIDFQEGFAGDTVIARADGAEVLRAENVRTKRILGYAGSYELQVPDGASVLQINVVNKNILKEIPLVGTEYIGISIRGDKIEYIESHERFGYA